MENLLKLYLKQSFTENDSQLIESAINSGELDTTDIKEDCMNYIYKKLDDEGIDDIDDIDIWNYTDEHLQNGLTHYQNYFNLIEYLKRHSLIA